MFFFSEGVRVFLLASCVCVGGGWGGGGRDQVQYLSFREKNNRPPPINK